MGKLLGDTTGMTRKEKSMEVKTSTSGIAPLEAEIAELTEDVTTLTKAIAVLDHAMREASELREEKKARDMPTIADAQAAQAAVAQALTVLKNF